MSKTLKIVLAVVVVVVVAENAEDAVGRLQGSERVGQAGILDLADQVISHWGQSPNLRLLRSC